MLGLDLENHIVDGVEDDDESEYSYDDYLADEADRAYDISREEE